MYWDIGVQRNGYRKRQENCETKKLKDLNLTKNLQKIKKSSKTFSRKQPGEDFSIATEMRYENQSSLLVIRYPSGINWSFSDLSSTIKDNI